MSIPSWDGAPQISSNSWTSSGTIPKQETELPLQTKLHNERLDLSEKIQKLKTFVTMSPDYKTLDYRQSRLLEEQLSAMQMYENVLVQRMALLNNPNNN
jgi:hypothetical protein